MPFSPHYPLSGCLPLSMHAAPRATAFLSCYLHRRTAIPSLYTCLPTCYGLVLPPFIFYAIYSCACTCLPCEPFSCIHHYHTTLPTHCHTHYMPVTSTTTDVPLPPHAITATYTVLILGMV